VLRGPENRVRRRVRDAEGVGASRTEGMGRDYIPLPSQLGGLGERRKLPSELEPRSKMDFGAF